MTKFNELNMVEKSNL